MYYGSIKYLWYEWGFLDGYNAAPTEYEWRCQPFSFDNIKRGTVSYDDKKNEVCSLAVAYDNLKLASTLDKSIYSSYINSRRGRINQHKQLLENYFNRIRAYGYEPPPNTYKEYVTLLKTI